MMRTARDLWVRSWPATGLIILVLVVALLGSLGSGNLQRTGLEMLIRLLMVVALYIFVGNSGILSFGHVGFAAIGAYTAALLRVPEDKKAVLMSQLFAPLQSIESGFVVATVAGGVVAALVAIIVGIPLMRLTGIAAALGTFAFLGIVFVVASNFVQVTNGSFGISGIQTSTTLPAMLIWVPIAIAAAYAFQQSRTGLRLRAARDEEIAARAIGIGVTRERVAALVVSSFFAGVGGALYAQWLGAFTAELFYLQLTFVLVVMLVVGGIGSLSGAVIGAISVTVLGELLRRLEQGVTIGSFEIPKRLGLREVGLGVTLLVILMLRPDGITRGRELRWGSRRKAQNTMVTESPQAGSEDLGALER